MSDLEHKANPNYGLAESIESLSSKFKDLHEEVEGVHLVAIKILNHKERDQARHKRGAKWTYFAMAVSFLALIVTTASLHLQARDEGVMVKDLVRDYLEQEWDVKP